MKEKNNKIRFLENSLLVNDEILVLTDFHIGYEEYLFGKLIPIRAQLDEIMKNLEKIFSLLDKEGIKIKEIVILGDLKHEFGEITDSEWRETLLLLDYLGKNTGKIILVKGNHDNILGPIAKKREVELRDYYKLGNICFLHGDSFYDE
jgi:putative SbcD/Mre11-related phosphoesterase